MTSKLIVQFRERLFNRIDEIRTAGNYTAQSVDRIAFGEIVGHNEHLTVFLETMGRALDHVVGGLAGSRKQDFNVTAGLALWRRCRRTRAIKKDRDRLAGRIVVLRQNTD